ncbi:MAG TPA: phosphodiester glycosidase family protein [Coleofasciculaceae cyanobacterium]
MKLFWMLTLAFVGLEALLFYVTHTSPPSAGSPAVAPATPAISTAAPAPSPIRYAVQSLPQAEVHTLVIPAQHQVLVAVSDQVATLKDFAVPYGAIAVINGGFFDPENQKSTSYVTLQGQTAADPQQNDRLTNNPNLAPYLAQIFNRTEFRQYRCQPTAGQSGPTLRYDIVLHTEPPAAGCQIVNALGAGPSLLPQPNLQSEGFLDLANGEVIRDAIDQARLSPRSAVGLRPDGSVILVMVAQKPEAIDASGMTLQQLADLMKSLGAEKAMNLDGGSSTSLYYNGTTHYGKLDEQGNPVERPVKSVLLVK